MTRYVMPTRQEIQATYEQRVEAVITLFEQSIRWKSKEPYFNQLHHIPLERTHQILTDLYGLGPGDAILVTTNQKLVQQPPPQYSHKAAFDCNDQSDTLL